MLQDYLVSLQKEFHDCKSLGEKTFAQLTDQDLNWVYNAECNSIASIVKHMHGNMLSRWTDFLSTDGEKEWRQRDDEFISNDISRDQMLNWWNEGWDCFFEALNSINDQNINSVITIRNQPHSITAAFNRQLAHYASHIGQIIYIGKMLKGASWQSLSIPRKK